MSNKIGRFEILGEITRSATGCVYKANDPENKQTIALKTLKLASLGDQRQTLLQRFLEEAESTKALNSPNIALVYGAGEIDGQFCAAMEYVQGKSIATMLGQGEEFSVWDLRDIVRQVCQGLDHAHARKVIHQSLEAGKVMVQWDGMVKILGFGISAVTLCSEDTAPVVRYMSPEQVRGETLDARSNVFSLGAIVYEMATGRRAFDGATEQQIEQQILEAMPVAPCEINKKLLPAISEVILKALSKDPDGRYRSGQELVRDLEDKKESAGQVSAAKSTVAKPPAAQPNPPATQHKAAAAAAGAEGTEAGTGAAGSLASKLSPADQFITACVKASVDAAIAAPGPQLSAAPAPAKTGLPGRTVDPLMTPEESTPGAKSKSFSEIDELPPLKEIYVPVAAAPDAPDPLQELREPHFRRGAPADAAKSQPKETAKKAVEEIAKTPPKLFLYSIGGALVIILLVVGLIVHNIRSENPEEEKAAESPASVSSRQTSRGSLGQGSGAQTSAATAQGSGEDAGGKQTYISVAPKVAPKKPGKPAAPVAVQVPGQLNINSNPEGAHILVDGQGDPRWITPYDVTGLAPGQHAVTLSKPGYTTETRTIAVASRSKSVLAVQLAQVGATVLVAAEPPGAQILLDGKDTGRVTPSQIVVTTFGNHTLLVRKQGYLDESTTVNLQSGQSFRYVPALRQLGSTDEIKTVGKFKLFGGKPDGMGLVSIKTQPKNAQIAINRRILDKNSPADFYLNPGTYVVDITLTGHKSVQRIISVEKSGKVAIDEALDRE